LYYEEYIAVLEPVGQDISNCCCAWKSRNVDVMLVWKEFVCFVRAENFLLFTFFSLTKTHVMNFCFGEWN
jgi:hypothetical protein